MGIQPIRVLHIEDDATDALLMHEIIKGDGNAGQFAITHVQCLKAALQEMRQTMYDAVLLDLNLTDICGIDNIKALVDQDPDLPVVVLSGFDSDDIALKAIEHGAQEYLVKGHGDGQVIRFAIRSSIQRKAMERRLFRQANYDDITGLPNHRLFKEYLERTLARARRWKRSESLMFIDLDDFKAVNDRLGHEAGNHVLKETAARMLETLRGSDMVARYGGDEFVILLDDHSDDLHYACSFTASRLLKRLAEPVHYKDQMISVGASIGIALYPEAGEDPAALLKSADNAMYLAKKEGGCQFCFARDLSPPRFSAPQWEKRLQ